MPAAQWSALAAVAVGACGRAPSCGAGAASPTPWSASGLVLRGRSPTQRPVFLKPRLPPPPGAEHCACRLVCERSSSRARIFLFEYLEVEPWSSAGHLVPPRAARQCLESSLSLTDARGCRGAVGT